MFRHLQFYKEVQIKLYKRQKDFVLCLSRSGNKVRFSGRYETDRLYDLEMAY